MEVARTFLNGLVIGLTFNTILTKKYGSSAIDVSFSSPLGYLFRSQYQQYISRESWLVWPLQFQQYDAKDSAEKWASSGTTSQRNSTPKLLGVNGSWKLCVEILELMVDILAGDFGYGMGISGDIEQVVESAIDMTFEFTISGAE